mgnify:CR=1 FL=1
MVCTNSLLVGTRAGLLSCRQVMQGGRYSGKGDAAWQAQPEAAAALLLVPLIRHALSAPGGTVHKNAPAVGHTAWLLVYW